MRISGSGVFCWILKMPAKFEVAKAGAWLLKVGSLVLVCLSIARSSEDSLYGNPDLFGSVGGASKQTQDELLPRERIKEEEVGVRDTGNYCDGGQCGRPEHFLILRENSEGAGRIYRRERGGSSSDRGLSAAGSLKGRESSRLDKLVYSVAVIKSFFSNGVQKQGYGLLLRDGFLLVSSSLVTEPYSFPKKIEASMQDDTSNTLIYVSTLDTKASDDTAGLAVLETDTRTDVYGNDRPESYYHKRIDVKYARDINPSKDQLGRYVLNGKVALYPTVSSENSMEVREAKLSNLSNAEIAKYGLPLFADNGEFVGIFDAGDGHEPRLLSNSKIKQFLCSLAGEKIITAPNISGFCGV